MAGNVKGIIVEIGGDTSGLQKALSKVNSATSSLSKELRGINSLLKLDPKNAELLNQKQTVLNQSIQTTEEKLKQLQRIKEEADKKMADGTEINEENYRVLQREIINTQNKLSNLKNEASNWTKAGDALIKWGENLDKISSKLDSLGNKLTTRLTAPIAAVATAGITYDAQIEKYETAFKTFLGSAEKAGEAIKNIKDDAKRTPFDTTSLVKANQMLISTGVSAEDAREDILALGEAVIATGGGNDELTRMASNLQQIKNAGKATAMDIRQFAYAGIDVYGILADYTGKATDQIKDMEISYTDLTKALKKASSKGGKYFGAMANSSEILTGQVSALKSEVQDMTGDLTKSLMPVAKKVVAQARDLIKRFDSLSDSQKNNIVNIGLMVAAAGPLLKIGSSAISIVGNVSKGVGTFTKAISLAHNGIGDATGSAATLAKVFQGLTSPIGLAATGITVAVGVIIAEIAKAEAQVREKFETMGNAATNFYSDLEAAQGYLNSFNETIFASTEEQEELQRQMDEIQKGITNICKTASDERRDYTQEEINQLNEYFDKLRELKDREIKIYQARIETIAQLAEAESNLQDVSIEEYKERGTEWIATAKQQAEELIKVAENRRIEEIAALNAMYDEKDRATNQDYLNAVANAEKAYQEAVDAANKQVGAVSKIYSEGYAERINIDDEFYNKIQENLGKQEKLEKEHQEEIKALQLGLRGSIGDTNQAIEDENLRFSLAQKEIWNEMYQNMSDSEAEQLGVWLAWLSNTEMYGGEISEENKKIVNEIIDSYDKMPEGTRDAMKNAMKPMLEEMENKEPSLFAKASSIADGILKRLKKAFDEHSPSKETRKIFRYFMEGAELGLEDEEKNLNKQVDGIANQMKSNFSNMVPNMKGIKQSVIDSTKTIFTTPQIIFNVQELDEAKLKQCLNYVNRKLR